jgi:RiboL-PSP-HEPN
LNVRKGLFLVLLYGAFEYSLTRTLTEVCALINNLRVEYCHISEMLYPLALDPELTSVSSVGRDSKWQKRADLFRKQACADPVILLDGAFVAQMDNVWAATVQKMFDVFGVNRPALYDVKVRQYIDGVVDKRNAVAHGRDSAAITGQSYTTRDLQKLIDDIATQTQYIFSSFEGHIAAKSFIRIGHQALY